MLFLFGFASGAGVTALAFIAVRFYQHFSDADEYDMAHTAEAFGPSATRETSLALAGFQHDHH